MNNGFDKNAFKKKQDKISLIFLLIGAVGIVSVILSFFIGNGIGYLSPSERAEREHQQLLEEMEKSEIHENDSFGVDTKNYYNTYYAAYDNEAFALEITEQGVKLSASTPFSYNESSFSYRFADAKYAKQKLGEQGIPTLILYKDSVTEPNALVRLNADGNVTLEGNDLNQVFTTTKITFEDVMNSPKDFYGKYYAEKDFVIEELEITENRIKSVMKSENGIEETVEYNYVYVNEEYAMSNFSGVTEHALIAFVENHTNELRIFELYKTNGGYELKSNSSQTYTTEEITIDGLLNDPKDYYGSYYFENSGIVISENTLTLYDDMLAAQTTQTEYNYRYFPASYANIRFELQRDILVCYNKETGNAELLFELIERSDGYGLFVSGSDDIVFLPN